MDESPRLRYESLTSEHAPVLYPVLAHDSVYEFLATDLPSSQNEFHHEFATRERGIPPSDKDEEWLNFVVFQRGGSALGRVEATRVGDWAEVAYLFGPEVWGHGFATEAMTWLHAYLADHTKVTCTWAAVLPGNVRSRKLLDRLGYAEVAEGWPRMRSYDPGDIVYRRPL